MPKMLRDCIETSRCCEQFRFIIGFLILCWWLAPYHGAIQEVALSSEDETHLDAKINSSSVAHVKGNTRWETLKLYLLMDPSNIEGDDSTRKKVPRCATQMKGLTLMANEGKRLVVNYNSYNQPIDKSSEKFTSYVGAKVRQHIPIDIKNWRSVPTNLKDNIWIDVKKAFTLEEERKHDLLKAAGKQWKGFKSYLTSEYIAKGLTANPPQFNWKLIYTDEEADEVREEWTHFLVEQV